LHRAFGSRPDDTNTPAKAPAQAISSSMRPSTTRAGHVASATSAGAAVAAPVRTSKRP